MYVDGSSGSPYGPGWSDRIKTRVKERDNYTCQYCGMKDGGAYKVHVHHKDFGKTNHAIDNLITVCSSCHSKLHESHTNFYTP